jgi:hypothetical protein
MEKSTKIPYIQSHITVINCYLFIAFKYTHDALFTMDWASYE